MSRRALVLAVLALAGCERLTQLTSTPPQTLSSPDRSLELTVPGSWKVDQLNRQAVLQASDRPAELYVIVVTQPKDGLGGMTLEKFSQTTRKTQVLKMQHASETGPTARTINGMPAVEYVLKGTVDRQSVVMKHVAFEGRQRYHQALAWTLASRWERERAGLDAVVGSLTER